MNSARAIGKCLCVGFSTCPPPNLPRGRGRSRGSLPARGESWGGGYAQISLQRHLPIAGTQFTKISEIETPSLRFPLQAGGTE